MPDEVVDALKDLSPTVLVDGTFGGGGHARRLVDHLDPGGVIVAMDRDPAVFDRWQSEAIDVPIDLFLGSYERIPQALESLGRSHADGLVLDLGLSSDQLADRERGFSYRGDGELDMRFDPDGGVPAWRWLELRDETEIADAIYQYGEERKSRRVARAIVESRRRGDPVRTVGQLAAICQRAVPRGRNHKIDPSTRTFQALRIAVNDELGILKRTLDAAPTWIRSGGRAAIISFHSLEDRIVKHAFRDDERWRVETPKPLLPTDREIELNPRSRSAKLRVATRV